jgi:hypothetical protein
MNGNEKPKAASPSKNLLENQVRRINRSKLAPLRGMIAKGAKPFDVQAFRTYPHDPTLRV